MKKLRTGFEVGRNSYTFDLTNSPTIFNGIYGGYRNGWSITLRDSTFSALAAPLGIIQYNNNGRTLTNTKGGQLYGFSTQAFAGAVGTYDLSKFSNGYYCQWWWRPTNWNTSYYAKAIVLKDNSTYYSAQVVYNGADYNVVIRNNTTQTDLASSPNFAFPNNVWINGQVSLTDNGDLTVSINGQTASTSLGVMFSAWEIMSFPEVGDRIYIDDMAVNDGSGATDNGLPGSIRSYTYNLNSTLKSNNAFNTVGGGSVLANLLDGNIATGVESEQNGAQIVMSLPPLSASGILSATYVNFGKIESFVIHGQALESTKVGATLSAVITDNAALTSVGAIYTMPLIGENRQTYFSNTELSLTNLSVGAIDLVLTLNT